MKRIQIIGILVIAPIMGKSSIVKKVKSEVTNLTLLALIRNFAGKY